MKWLGLCVLVAMATSPAMAVFVDNFNSYSGGALAGQGPWTGAAGVNDVAVYQEGPGNMAVKVISTTGTNLSAMVTVADTGTITVQVDIRGDVGAVANGNFYNSSLTDTAGMDLARWYGQADRAVERISPAPAQIGQTHMLTDGLWHRAMAIVNPAARTTQYWWDGVLSSTLAWSASQTGIPKQWTFQATAAKTPITALYFDNLSIPEPASLILLGLGGMLVLRRRA